MDRLTTSSGIRFTSDSATTSAPRMSSGKQPRAARGGAQTSQSQHAKHVARADAGAADRVESAAPVRSKTRAATAPSNLPDGRQSRRHQSRKVFWPAARLTKGDLLRYYAEVVVPHPSGGCRPSAGDEAVSERHRRHGVLPAALAPGETAAGVRIETLPEGLDPISRARRAPFRRRRSLITLST